uniref:Uncharacterized protein n=1 Tax=viral metagenome TaxID=1070528 RepID=A0A6M3J0U5_9ZZZZ
MEWSAVEISLCQSIATRYWRRLKTPDFYWDQDLMMALPWVDIMEGSKRPKPMNTWPLWTTDDALAWVKTAGHQFVSCYYFRKPERYEVYFTYGEWGRLVKTTEDSILTAMLRFIDNALKGEYDETEEKPEKKA